jgi:alpha-ribazole phosphatase
MIQQITTLDMIRHGEPQGGRRYRGQRDDPLSELGWAQMRAAVAGHAPWSTIITSPLSRCQAFAAELAGQLNLPLEIEPDLGEGGFGVWEGLTSSAIELRWPGAIARFRRDPLHCQPDGAEPIPLFYRRVAAVIDAILQRHAGGHPLLVGHAGQMRMAMAHLLELPAERLYRFDVRNAGVSRLRIVDQGDARIATLIFHNANLSDHA